MRRQYDVLLLCFLTLAACGKQLVDFSNTGGTAPAVTSTDPVNLSNNVPVAQRVNATFSEAMDPATITLTTFTLTQGTNVIAGAATYSAVTHTATLSPTVNLTAGTTYTGTVTIGATNVAGNALAANFVWTFTTATTIPVNTPPQVTSTNPANGVTNLCIPFGIDATFDKQLDPLTVVPANFTLSSPGPTPVPGSTSYNAQTRTATFSPSNSLLANTKYTATVTTGIKDAAGDPLAANKVWTFTTNANVCVLPPNLRSLASFVAVAGSGLTNSNTQPPAVTTLNGDVGLSPTATCKSDGIDCDPAAGAPRINGTLYKNDPAGKAATAKADLVSAYNDAVGRTQPPPTTVLGNLAGQTLAPGIYFSGSTMDIAVNGTLTLDAQNDPNAVWIFQIGSALTANTGAKVLLINGAKAANVFWAVGSSSTLGANVDFSGTVMAQSSNSVGTGSTVLGRLVCTTGAISLLSNTITLPPL
jgi:hypothetical protein